MATPIDPNNVDDWDEALNTDPTYTAVHVFSTDDITGTFDGVTQGEDGGVIDFTTDPMVTKEGVNLYPTDTEFGYVVTDFVGAEQKTIDGLYEEGWVGDLEVAGEHVGLVVSNEPTDFFKTPALLGTWLAGLGGNTVKASTEHYSVMQNVLSDQRYPGDLEALYPLDDNLIMIGGEYDGLAVKDIIAGADLGAGTSTVVTDEGTPEEVTHVVTIVDRDGDGAITLMDLLEPNETEIDINIAASDDYSVTMKDDGKLLYRWGNTIKKPNDVRIEAEIDLPDEWSVPDVAYAEDVDYSELKSLYRVTEAELVTHHTITNNPNDQIRPEDFENEAAIGTLPTYDTITTVSEVGADSREIWFTTEDYYAGDGTLYTAGTILKDSDLAFVAATSDIVMMGAGSVDLLEGYTNAWYTTMDREPFEPVLNDDGTEYEGSGPRWRLQPDKYGQDLPSVVIPEDPSLTSNPSHDEVKYEVGAETQTVLNLLDWEYPISPLSISAGWQDAPGEVTENGLNMTENFDVAFYIKGDIKPATIYSTELVLSYEELEIYGYGEDIFGEEGVVSDYLVGIGNNTFTGGLGADLFVLSYGTTVTDIITANIVTDFEVGIDTIGFIGLDVNDLTFGDLVTQELGLGGWEISIGGELVATLEGVTEELDMEGNFFMTNPGPAGDPVPVDPPEPPTVIHGTEFADTLIGTLGDDIIFGYAGNDYIYSLAGEDTLDGGEGLDRLYGGADADVFVFAEGTGLDIVYDFDDGIDMIRLEGVLEADFGTPAVTVSDYRTTGALIEIGDDRMIVRSVVDTALTIDDFIFDDTAIV
jgi:hypothetical protein